ncbi:WAP four-disulfide core domain protein 3-like [Falco rusticolus]|uniref:WAP four-disulfide core domain protein 3-like n=1 Tax=Falco rusticolus TaxID=120794 RepID=UPI000FFBC691|nr:WAP four-disulfide core domain protein 3-like [Falco rusticolus]
MLGERTLLLVLLALFMELLPALAQQHHAGDQGTAPMVTPAPRWALQGRWPLAALPAPGKVGRCPAGGSGAARPHRLYCFSDHSCPGAEKCCQSRQVRTCLLPTAGTADSHREVPVWGLGGGWDPCSLGTWPHRASPSAESPGYCPHASSTRGVTCGMSCHNDTACSPGEKCCIRGCCARCMRAEPAKPGFCPWKRVQRRATACPNRCADDRDCPGDRKCCFSGCGLACTPRDTVKAGACPVVLRGSLGPCLELCDADGNCPGATKCCTTGCGHICKLPTKVRPGLCPPMADGDQVAECLLLCLQDKDCPPGQKCCPQGCGRACVPPLWGTA